MRYKVCKIYKYFYNLYKFIVFLSKYFNKNANYLYSQQSITKLQQFFIICKLVLTKQITPYSFYTLHLYKKQTNVQDYITENISSCLFKKLNNFTSPKPLNNKITLQKLCKKNNIKIPITYSIINKTIDLNKLPKGIELFTKPTNGVQSYGINTIINKNNIWYCNNKQVNENELKNIIFNNKKYKEYLVQEKLLNHKDLLNFSETDVCSLRIITGNKNNKNIEYFTSNFRIPIPEKDYFVREKKFHVAPVNKNGVLGKAYYGPDIINWYSKHKFNNAQIEGVQLPFWQEAVDMSVRIHKQLKQFRFVAWDIVLTDNGAVMLEGNHSWGTSSVQRAHDKSMYDLGFWDFIEDKV